MFPAEALTTHQNHRPIWGASMRASPLWLWLLVGLWESGRSHRSCPDLIVDSCHCSAERSKELSRQQHVRVKVVCDDVDLMDTLQPNFLPNRTVSL